MSDNTRYALGLFDTVHILDQNGKGLCGVSSFLEYAPEEGDKLCTTCRDMRDALPQSHVFPKPPSGNTPNAQQPLPPRGTAQRTTDVPFSEGRRPLKTALTAGERTALGRAENVANPMPDFNADPALWNDRMRGRMFKALQARGIDNPTNRNDIIAAAFKVARPGSERSVFGNLSREIRKLRKSQKAYTAERATIKAVEEWLIRDCMFGAAVVRQMMSQSGTANPDRPILDRLTDITMMAVDRQFNAHKQHAKHWAANAADPAVVGLWRHITEVAEDSEWGMQERIGKINIALGSVASVYLYPGTLDQARAAFDKAYCSEGETMGNGLGAQAADLGPMFGAFNDLCSTNSVPNVKAFRDRIRHEATGYTSWTGLPVGVTPGDLMTKTRAFVLAGAWKAWPADGVPPTPPADDENLNKIFPRDANNQPANAPAPLQSATTVNNAPVTTPPATPIPETPNNAPAPPTARENGASPLGMSEAGFSITFKWVDGYGSEQQFTMRQPTWKMGLAELPKFHADLRAMGYMPYAEFESKRQPAPAPQVQQPSPANSGAMLPPPSASTQQQPAAQSQGGTIRCAQIKKFSDDGKTSYQFFEHAGDEQPCLRINNETVAQRVLAAHIGIEQMTINTRYPMDWNVDWQPSKKINERNNKPYRDVVAVRPIQQATAA